MMETYEDISFTLDIAGEVLEFSSTELRAIAGDIVYNVQSYDSVYDLEKQDIDFRCSHRDWVESGVKDKDMFTYTIPNSDVTFSYQVLGNGVPDTTGWCNFRAMCMGIAG